MAPGARRAVHAAGELEDAGERCRWQPALRGGARSWRDQCRRLRLAERTRMTLEPTRDMVAAALDAAAIPSERCGATRTSRLSEPERELYRWILDRFAF